MAYSPGLESKQGPYRIGLIVPSSNTTMETEIPRLLASHPVASVAGFTFHGARMRMTRVIAEELRRMNEDAAGCVAALADARCDVMAYACLVAVMVQGANAHARVSADLGGAASAAGWPAPVVTSAGALVEELQDRGYRKVALIAPYVPKLTSTVVAYLEAGGVEVTDSISLSVADNCEVGRLSETDLVEVALQRLRVGGADAVIASCCVQMPSLAALPIIEGNLGLPCLSAATATARQVLKALQLDPAVAGYGTYVASGAEVAA
jgi:maleate isomerase